MLRTVLGLLYPPRQVQVPTAGLQPEPSSLLNTDVCANDVILKDINTGVQVANVNPQRDEDCETLITV